MSDARFEVPEPSSRSGCAVCPTARCCVVFDPEMTGADLHRLVRGLHLAPGDVAELRPVRIDEGEGDAIVLAPGCGWELRLRRTTLARAPGAPPAEACGCLVSLAPDVHRCGVYAHRPMVCRTFPSDLTPFGVMVGNPEGVCPPGSWSQARADLGGLHRLHRRAAAERELHRAFVARWNEAPPAETFDALTAAMLAFWDAVGPLGDPARPDSAAIRRALDDVPSLAAGDPRR